MPVINLNLSVRLTEAQREAIKGELGQHIALIPGKSEEYLMVLYNDGQLLSFRGQWDLPCGYVDVRMKGDIDQTHKTDLANAIFDLLETTAHIPREQLYISFLDYEYFGSRGRYTN
jgi:phenylpyruvate tautomerase PptA (4-oxalocrotonate tautomerase family)